MIYIDKSKAQNGTKWCLKGTEWHIMIYIDKEIAHNGIMT